MVLHDCTFDFLVLQTNTPSFTYTNNCSTYDHKPEYGGEELDKVADNSFGDSDNEENDDFPDHFDDPNYVLPTKEYIDVLKEYFGHAKFRP